MEVSQKNFLCEHRHYDGHGVAEPAVVAASQGILRLLLIGASGKGKSHNTYSFMVN